MLIDLQNGQIDSYNFKLTSNGIQIQSTPNTTNTEEDYYLRILGGAMLPSIGDEDPDEGNNKENYVDTGSVKIFGIEKNNEEDKYYTVNASTIAF